MLLHQSFSDSFNHWATFVFKSLDIAEIFFSTLLQLYELKILVARDKVFYLHVYFANVCGCFQIEWFQQFISSLLSSYQFFPDLLCADTSRPNLATQKIHVKFEKCLPISFVLILVDSDFRCLLQNIEHHGFILFEFSQQHFF